MARVKAQPGEQSYGVYMLTAVGAGLICYGLYLMVKAKVARM